MTSPEAPSSARRKDKLLNSVLAGKYKILKKIGEGGMGSVYIATQEPIDRKVAVKVLLGRLAEDEIAVKRFEQEARAISKMQHPNTVTIYDFGRTEDDDGEERLYIVMEYLKGRTLTQVLRAEQQMVGPRASRIIRQVCASLADAHAAGIIHRDLKPDNIFLTEVGGDRDWVKVLDFGVAKLADSEAAGTLTQTGMIFGTPKYMSPEQAEGRPIDYRADIYALGIVMYELLAGRPPFVADTPVALLLKHISEPPPSFATLRPDLEVDSRLEAIVMKAMAKDPDQRFQMVAEFAAELENYERAVSGGYVIPTGTVPTPLAGGMPTEVVGGEPVPSVTPSQLRSPHEAPEGLSAGVPAPGVAAGPQGGTAAVPELQQTERGHPLNRTVPDSGADWARGGATGPGSAPGAGTSPGLGSTGADSFGVPAPESRSSTPLLLAVAGLTMVGALGIGVAVLGGSSDPRSIDSVPLSAPGASAASPTNPDGEGGVASAPEDEPTDPESAAPDPASESELEAVPGSDRPRTGGRRPTVAQRNPEPAKPSRVPLEALSEPANARVFLNGTLVGKTPLELPPLEVGQTVELEFRRKGYAPITKKITVGEKTRVSATLTRVETSEPPPRKKSPQELLREARKLKEETQTRKVSDLK